MKTLIAVCALLFATSALAAPKLMRPVSVQEGRYTALKAAGIDNVWAGKHNVTLVGFSQTGKTIVMVKSPELKTPALVTLERRQTEYGSVQGSKLDDKQMKKIGLITPTKAFAIAMQSGGLFKDVKGEVQFAGSSHKGYAYKLIVTPKAPVTVKAPYGTYTVSELTRMVSALGTGESAYPTPGKYTFKYGK